VGINKTIIGSAISIAVIFVLFSTISKNGENSDNQGNFISENSSKKPGFVKDPHLSDSRKADFPSQSEKSVSSNIPTDSQSGIVPRIARFFQTGEMEEIRDLPREDIRIAIEAYVSMQSKDQLAETLHQYLGMPYDLFYSIEQPEDYLEEVSDLVREDIDKPLRLTNLVITDSCSEDGAVSGATHIIPEGSQKIFAVFENCNALEGIETVYAVWRDLNDDSLSFSEYEPLREHSRYNYVWLEQEDGWKKGAYQLDLADSKSPSRILATTRFKVQ
jgi:hypothetical protein